MSKAAAYTFRSDAGLERHLIDFAVLGSLIGRSDRIAEQLTQRDRQWLSSMLGVMANSRSRWVGIADAERGIAVLRAQLEPQGG